MYVRRRTEIDRQDSLSLTHTHRTAIKFYEPINQFMIVKLSVLTHYKLLMVKDIMKSEIVSNY